MGSSPGASAEDVVLYLAKRTKINGTRLQKLVYLVEAEFADRSGRRLFDFDYFYNHFGMNAHELERRVLKLGGPAGPVSIQTYPTDRGTGFAVQVKPETKDPGLQPDVRAVCDFVLKTYGALGLKELMTTAKATLPFAGTKPGERVDWSVIADCGTEGCSHELSPEGLAHLQENFS